MLAFHGLLALVHSQVSLQVACVLAHLATLLADMGFGYVGLLVLGELMAVAECLPAGLA